MKDFAQQPEGFILDPGGDRELLELIKQGGDMGRPVL